MSSLKVSELTSLLNKSFKETGRLRKGNNLQYHCPFCHHHKMKMEVCLDEPHNWHCWVCNAKGRGIYWLLKRMNVGQDVLTKVENIFGSATPKHSLSVFDAKILSLTKKQESTESSEMLSLMPEFKSLAENDGSREYNLAINYAKKRKITMCDIIKHNVGYCAKGPFSNRLVFPSYDKHNNLNFYSCRSYYDDGYKYKNSEFSKDIVGFENLVDFDFPIYLCEGALDAISLKRNAIPLFGKSMSKKLKQAIIQSNCPEVNIVLDDDALDSAIKIAEYIRSIGKEVKIVKLEGKDPNVLGFAKTMEQIKKTDLLDFSSMIRLKLE
jgi:ribosomal protein L37AE/L43A